MNQYKGLFNSQQDVINAFPHGGQEGDWLHIKTKPTSGIGDSYDIYQWNSNVNLWELQYDYEESVPYNPPSQAGTGWIAGIIIGILAVAVYYGFIALGNLVAIDEKPVDEMTRKEYQQKLERDYKDYKDYYDNQPAFPEN